jgi:AbrB family looped-hinge helix DNA binding protein
MKFPEDKDLCTVRVGEKGQIVIPKNMREMFGIKPGDSILLLADAKRGIAIVHDTSFLPTTFFDMEERND